MVASGMTPTRVPGPKDSRNSGSASAQVRFQVIASGFSSQSQKFLSIDGEISITLRKGGIAATGY